MGKLGVLGMKEGLVTGLPRPAPEDGSRISGAYLSLISVAFSELRRDMTLLIDTGWAEPVRRRAEELASTLCDACDRQGLAEVAARARSIANLTRLSKGKAVPIKSAIREKFRALDGETQKLLAKHSNRYIG